MEETFIENKKSEIIDLIKDKKSGGKILLIISEVFRSGVEFSRFTDFVADVFLTDPDSFNKNVRKSYNKKITSLLNEQQLIEMEETILRKHCLYQDEKILVSFRGVIKMSSDFVNGRIYLTNYRIIAQGFTKSKALSKINLPRAMMKAVFKYFQKIMNQLTSAELPCFGYQYPTFGLEKIKKLDTQVFYTVRIKPESLVYYEKYKFEIIVKRFRGEALSDFDTRANEVTNILHDTIIDTSKKFEE